MSSPAPTGFVLAAASTLLLGVSLVQAAREIGPYLDSGSSAQTRFHAIVEGEYRPGPSYRSKDMFLRDCQDVGGGLYAAVQTGSKRQSFFAACRDAARLMLQWMPAYSRAWLVEAETSAALGDSAGMREGLVRSAVTAPGAHWLIERRLTLAARHFDALGTAELSVFDDDVRAALEGSRSMASLAELYLNKSALRPRIAAAASAAPPSAQRRFLAEVRRHER